MPYPYIVLITFQKLYLAFLAAFPLLLCVAFLIVYQSVPVIHTDEYAPQTIPARSGIANSLTESTPSIASMNTMKNVVSDVLILLVNVCVILSFTISESLSSVIDERVPMFSRIRSNMTIVAFIE